MKKLFLKFLILCVALCSALTFFVACDNGDNDDGGNNPPAHTHVYNKQVIDDDYKKADATCESAAVYYYSCDCGEKGSDTFEYGSKLDHKFSDWISNGDGTHSQICAYNSQHKITADCSGGEATEQSRPICEVCKSEYGATLGHTHKFNMQKTTDKFVFKDATCESAAVYYYSCDCGEKGNDTFEYGSKLGHKYGNWISNGDGTHSKICANDYRHVETQDCSGGIATCTTKKICDDCLEEYGSVLGHNYGDWIGDGYSTHSRVCANNNDHIETYDCYGGTASCTKYAICDVCNTKYGKLKDHTYSDEWTITASHHYKVATCGCELNKDYGEHKDNGSGYCSSCNESLGTTEGIIYTVSTDKTYATVTGYEGSATNIKIAGTYNDVPVTTIGIDAFYNKRNIEKVSIPISVTTICDRALNYCTSLKSIDIPASVITIGEEAFNRCVVLEKITFAENSKLEVIGKNAFAFCSSSLYTEKGGIKYVKANDNPYYILQELTNNTLSSYTIENNTVHITSFAFSGCSSLTSIDIPASVKSIGKAAFYQCQSMKAVKFGANSNLEFIADNAFYNCSVLEEIQLPDGLKTICDRAFKSCRKLSQIEIPSSVIKIGSNAFEGSKLETITFKKDSKLETIGDYAFANCPLINIEIPASVKSVGKEAFSYCTNLLSVTFEENSLLEIVREKAFCGCSNLKEIVIPASVIRMEIYVFSSCEKLTKIYCRAEVKPQTWHNNWNAGCSADVQWGYSN